MKQRLLLLIATLCFLATAASAQISGPAYRIYSGPTLPATCDPGSTSDTGVTDVFIKTTATKGIYYCSATNTWTNSGGGGGGGTPGGSDTNVQINDAGSFNGYAGFVFDKTSKISLGVAGTSVGAIGFRNATSGTLTLQPVTGALGTVTLSLPAATDTLVGRSTTDTLGNKTLTSPTVTGNIAADATTQVQFGSNYIRYTDALGPTFFDNTTGFLLRFNVQAFTVNRTVVWPDAALTVAGIDVANAWADGVKQTFNPNATNAGFNVGSVAGDPSTPVNGDLWYDSTANELTARINGVNVALGSGGGGGITIGTTTITSGTTTRFLYDNAGVVGETAGIVYSSSASTTFSVTGQSASQLTGLFTGAASSSSAILVAQLGAGSGGDSFQVRNSGGTAITVIDSVGSIGAGITSSLLGRVHGVAPAGKAGGFFQAAALDTATVLIARQGSSSTGDLIRGENSAGTALFAVNNSGNVNIGGVTSSDVRLTKFSNAYSAPSISLQGGAGADTFGAFHSGTASYGSAGATSILEIAIVGASGGRITLGGGTIGFASASATGISTLDGNRDTGIQRKAAGVLRVTGASDSGAGSLLLGTSTVGSIGTSGIGVFAIANGTAPTSSPADEFQLYSADSAAGDANAFARNEAGEINRLTGLTARVSTQFDKTSDTTLANVTGLSRNVEAGRTYAFIAVLYTSSNVAGGVKAAIGGTATATSVIYEAEVKDGSTFATMGTARATALATAVGDVTTVTAAKITITGTIVVNAAGTLTVQFAQNASNGSASSVLVNSNLRLIPIN